MLSALPSRVVELLTNQHGVATAAQLAALKFGDDRIATALRGATLVRLHRGAYALSGTWQTADARTRHCLRLVAIQVSAPDAVAWGVTAAVVWRLPVSAVPAQPVVVRSPKRGRSLAGASVRRLDISLEDVVVRHGLTTLIVTTAAVAVAGELPFSEALMTVDAVLRRGTARADLLAGADQLPVNRGRRVARDAISAGDPASESALESTSRGCMIQGGLPIPLCNVVLRVGDRWYRVDFLWLELGVVGECDGKTKYLDADVRDVMWREKRRHEQIEEWGFRVVRWGYAEVADEGGAMVRRIRRAIDAQSRLRFTWPDDVRAEVPVREGVQVPSRVIAEVNRLQALGYPITFVDEWGNTLTRVDDYSRFRAS